MILFNINNLNKSYGTKEVLKDINITLSDSTKVALIGINGAGKTTLFKTILNETEFDSGVINMSKGLKIGYIKQTDTFDEDMLLIDYCLLAYESIRNIELQMRNLELKIQNDPYNNILLEEYSDLTESFERLDGYAYESKAKGILRGLGFLENEFNRNLASLSGGQRNRITLAKLLMEDYDLLLLDEPTNHLDLEATSWLEDFLKESKSSLILISHDRYFIDKVVDEVWELENTKLTSYRGNYSNYMEQKRKRYEIALKEYEQNQIAIKREEEIIKEFRSRSTEKMMKRAKDRENKLSKIEVIDKPLWYSKKMGLQFQVVKASGEQVLIVDGITKSFNQKMVLNNISFNVYKQDRIGLIGKNGIGKTTLFKILTNELNKDEGIIKIGTNVFMQYYDQDLKGLHYSNDLVSELSSIRPDLDNVNIRTYLGSFLFLGDDVFKKVESLSGGEKARLSLLKLIMGSYNLLLLDEPTNHLDILSKETLESSLNNYDGTLLCISHDRYFLNNVCNVIFEMTENGIQVYKGNYDYYLYKKDELKRIEEELELESQEKLTKTERKELNKRQRDEITQRKKKTLEIKDIEKEIGILEHEKHDIEHLLCLEVNYKDSEKLKFFNQRLVQIENSLSEFYEIWENLI
jgi:ATP-binding cassette subfamily F protein 3